MRDGDISIYLAQHGWDVTAFDFVQVALDRDRAKATAAGAKIRAMQADVTRRPDDPVYVHELRRR